MTSVKTCYWKGCKTKIEVDTHLEHNSLFVVVGWCQLHQKAYRIYHDLERKYMQKNRISYMTEKEYNKHKKALQGLHELSEHRARGNTS